MNKTVVFYAVFFAAFVSASFSAASDREAVPPMRAEWVSTVSNIDYPSKPGLSADELRREADAILDRAVELGLNAIFLQVRPMGDAFYPSKIYPRSNFISGAQGKAPDGELDVLAYWLEGAHSRGLQLHAWVNPYRVTAGNYPKEKLAPTNPAILHPEWTFEFNGNIYLNPGVPEAREVVIAGMREIVENYDVDGVHIDDYFYPSRKMTNAGAEKPVDWETFQKYGAKFDNIEDWRRDNNDQFIKMADEVLHAVRADVVWSVSPAGIWANKSNNPLGSDTRGNENYYSLFADIRGWIKNEWIDAVVPQIYWHIGFEIAEFKTLVDWWADVVEGTDVKFYVGTAAYRVDPNSKTEAWRSPDELVRQLDYMLQNPNVAGMVFFTAHSLYAGTPAGDAVKQYADEKEWTAK